MNSLQGKRAIIVGAVVAVGAVLAAGAAINLLLTPPPFEVAPKVTKEAPAQPAGASASVPTPPAPEPGCWAVSATETTLTAAWEPACTAPTIASQGVQGWPTTTFRLPAGPGDGQPDMRNAQTAVTLSSEVAQFGEGALLYLPTGSEGSGYYVAGWQEDAVENDKSGSSKGIEIGRYGAPPFSIATPAGYVYLTRDFAPKTHRATREISDDDDSADTPDDSSTDADDADDPGTANDTSESSPGRHGAD